MILDLSVACSASLGAVLGWGILSPIAKKNGWAPGPVDSMETGVRGWLVWISIGFLLGDAIVRAVHESARFALRYYDNIRCQNSQARSVMTDSGEESSTQALMREETACDRESVSGNSVLRRNKAADLVSNQTVIFWLLGSTSLCILCIFLVFRQEVPIYLIVAAVAAALPLCLIVIQSAGETDQIPSNNLSKSCPLDKSCSPTAN